VFELLKLLVKGEGPFLFIMGPEKHSLKIFMTIYKVNTGEMNNMIR